MAKTEIDLYAFVGKLLEEQDGDALREGIRVLAQALMSTTLTNLGRGEVLIWVGIHHHRHGVDGFPIVVPTEPEAADGCETLGRSATHRR